MRTPLDAVILDLDGLVVDTEVLHYESWRAEAAALGRTLTQGSFARVVGVDLTDAESVRLLLGHEFVPRADSIAARTRRRREVSRRNVSAVPGAVELIRDVRAAGLALGLTTSSPRERVLAPLTRLGVASTFHAVCCRDDVGVGKPAPDVYLAVLVDRLGISPDRTAVAVEDSGNGARAAAAAGLGCVAVPRGPTITHDFRGCAVRLPSLVGVTAAGLAIALGMSLQTTQTDAVSTHSAGENPRREGM